MKCYKVSGEEYVLLNYNDNQIRKIKEIISDEYDDIINNINYFYKPENQEIDGKLFFEMINEMSYEDIIEKFIQATLKKDGKKNKNIRDSILYINKENEKIQIIRLEAKEDIGIETPELIKVSGKDSYKIFDIKKNNEYKIIVLDSNGKVSGYWLDKFLELKPELTSKVLTSEFLEILEKTNPNKQKIVINALLAGDLEDVDIKNFIQTIFTNEEADDFLIKYNDRHMCFNMNKQLLEEKLQKKHVINFGSNISIKAPIIATGDQVSVIIDDGNHKYVAMQLSNNYFRDNQNEFNGIEKINITLDD